MDKNDASLLCGIRAFAIAAVITFVVAFPLVLAGSWEIVAFFCPWAVMVYGNDILILVTAACRIGLLAGFLTWLRATRDEMRSSYEGEIAKLKTQVRTLEEKLDNTEKD